jgi:hypothetical protein
MFDLRQKILAVAIGGVIFASGASVFAQRDGERRPPKEDNKVVVQPKGQKPPPNSNSNQGNQGNKRDDRKKP